MITGHVVSARGDYFRCAIYNYQLCPCQFLWSPFAVLYTFPPLLLLQSNGGGLRGEYTRISVVNVIHIPTYNTYIFDLTKL